MGSLSHSPLPIISSGTNNDNSIVTVEGHDAVKQQYRANTDECMYQHDNLKWPRYASIITQLHPNQPPQ